MKRKMLEAESKIQPLGGPPRDRHEQPPICSMWTRKETTTMRDGSRRRDYRAQEAL